MPGIQGKRMLKISLIYFDLTPPHSISFQTCQSLTDQSEVLTKEYLSIYTLLDLLVHIDSSYGPVYIVTFKIKTRLCRIRGNYQFIELYFSFLVSLLLKSIDISGSYISLMSALLFLRYQQVVHLFFNN